MNSKAGRQSSGKDTNPFADEDDYDGDDKEKPNDNVEGDEDKKPPAVDSPGQLVEHPQRNDVLLGRGRPLQRHPGNVRFHQIVDRYRNIYVNAKKHEKLLVSRRVVSEVSTPSSEAPGGRFLRKVESGRYWEEVSTETVLEKTSHALRGRPKIGRELHESDNSGNKHPTRMGSFPSISALGPTDSNESTSREDCSRTSVNQTKSQALLLGYSHTVGTLPTSASVDLIRDGLGQFDQAGLQGNRLLQHHVHQDQRSERSDMTDRTQYQDDPTANPMVPPNAGGTMQRELQFLHQRLNESQLQRELDNYHGHQQQEVFRQQLVILQGMERQRRLLDWHLVNPIVFARGVSPGMIPSGHHLRGSSSNVSLPLIMSHASAAADATATVQRPHRSSSSSLHSEGSQVVASDEVLRRLLLETIHINQLRDRHQHESLGRYRQNNDLTSGSVVETVAAVAAAPSRSTSNTLVGSSVADVSIATITELLRYRQNEENRQALLEAIVRHLRPNG